MNIEFRDHPARDVVRDASTRQPLRDAETGKPITVPMFPGRRSIWVNGNMVGYCWAEPGKHISLIAHQPDAFCAAIKAAVDKEFGGAGPLTMPPPAHLTEELKDDDHEG